MNFKSNLARRVVGLKEKTSFNSKNEICFVCVLNLQKPALPWEFSNSWLDVVALVSWNRSVFPKKKISSFYKENLPSNISRWRPENRIVMSGLVLVNVLNLSHDDKNQKENDEECDSFDHSAPKNHPKLKRTKKFQNLPIFNFSDIEQKNAKKSSSCDCLTPKASMLPQNLKGFFTWNWHDVTLSRHLRPGLKKLKKTQKIRLLLAGPIPSSHLCLGTWMVSHGWYCKQLQKCK